MINRQRSREPRVTHLLRALCDASLHWNFTFAAVHRAGVDNVLMDWASRPDLHKFKSAPGELEGLAVVGGALGGGADTRFPPLLRPTSLSHISSRCLKFENQGNSTRWSSTSFGSSPCA